MDQTYGSKLQTPDFTTFLHALPPPIPTALFKNISLQGPGQEVVFLPGQVPVTVCIPHKVRQSLFQACDF